MRFVTFRHREQVRPGVILGPVAGQGPFLIDGAHPARPEALQGLAPDMIGWIEAGLDDLSRALSDETPHPDCLLPIADVALMAPIPRPGKIVGAAFNYRDALIASGKAFPTEPVLFVRSGRTVIGPGQTVHIRPDCQITYEAELAVVIGKTALKVDRRDALSYVSAYCLFNDVSYTNYVKEDGGFVRGKNQPTSGPLGPWLVPAHLVPDPHRLPIAFDINGRTVQSSSTEQMLFGIEALIEYASARMPLEPGDIIATGTPGGVAANHVPPLWLAGGQRMTVRMPDIGVLTNDVKEGLNV